MSAEASVAPSAARIARARQAGLRPASTWLAAGLGLCGLAAILPSSAPAIDTRTLTAALADGGRDAAALAHAWAEAALVPAVAIACVAVLAAATAAVLAGRVGAISRDAAELPDVRPSLRVAVVIAGLMLIWSMADLRAAIAGGARAADASADALATLWPAALARVALSIGAAMVALGALDIVVSRRRQLDALRTSVDEARREAQRSPAR